jgi:hypothetical protein
LDSLKPAHEREKDKVLMEQYMQQLNDHLAEDNLDWEHEQWTEAVG